MVERFLKQTSFTSTKDYNKNLQFIIPDNFNFAYDVMDDRNLISKQASRLDASSGYPSRT